MSNENKTAMWREYEKNTRGFLFAPYAPMRYPSNWLKNIKWFFKSFKYAAQRARRGYADCDLWDLDSYLTGLIAQALEDFAENMNGYPIEYEKYNTEDKPDAGAAEWAREIKNCSLDLFRSLESLEDFNYKKPDIDWDISVEEDGKVNFNSTSTEEEKKEWFKLCGVIAQERKQGADRAFLWLARHIMDLWD